MKKITSQVIRGIGIGKKIGYPTLNLAIPHSLKLKQGVYGCVVNLKKFTVHGILYFGPRFNKYSGDKEGITLEVHILDQKKTIPHIMSIITIKQKISVTIGSFLRSPIKILSQKNLKNQIEIDINKLTIDSCLDNGDKIKSKNVH